MLILAYASLIAHFFVEKVFLRNTLISMYIACWEYTLEVTDGTDTSHWVGMRT